MTQHDEYADYIKSIMEACIAKTEGNAKFEVTDIDNEYFATVEITGEKYQGKDGETTYNSLRVFGHEMEDLMTEMKSAGFIFNSARQFTRENEDPALDLLFVARDE